MRILQHEYANENQCSKVFLGSCDSGGNPRVAVRRHQVWIWDGNPRLPPASPVLHAKILSILLILSKQNLKELNMEYIWKYRTPEGFDDLVMSGDGEALTGLWFAGSRDAGRRGEAAESRDTPVFRETCRWLDEYFAGRDPGFTPNYRIEDLTEFRSAVINELKRIPFGATVSYGDIAKAISKKHGGAKVSARAVGGAVGWNPIGIIIPCHRVIGADNGLTGYGGGLGNKVSLLAHEGSDMFDARSLVPKESSDEFFLSFWRSPYLKEQRRLKRKFEKWIAADATWGEGTGEAWWLGAFLSKWTKERTFSYEQLQKLTQWHLERQMPTALDLGAAAKGR